MAAKDTKRKRCNEESKLQAAKLAVEGSYTYHQASQRLRVSDRALTDAGVPLVCSQ